MRIILGALIVMRKVMNYWAGVVEEVIEAWALSGWFALVRILKVSLSLSALASLSCIN